MAHEYEDQWDEFLDAFQKVRQRADQYQLLLVELIEAIESKEDKDRYLTAYKEITHGESISDS